MNIIDNWIPHPIASVGIDDPFLILDKWDAYSSPTNGAYDIISELHSKSRSIKWNIPIDRLRKKSYEKAADLLAQAFVDRMFGLQLINPQFSGKMTLN